MGLAIQCAGDVFADPYSELAHGVWYPRADVPLVRSSPPRRESGVASAYDEPVSPY